MGRFDGRPITAMGIEWFAVFFLLTLAVCTKGQEDLTALCRSAASRQSCGQCIKQSPQCVWCTDPAFSGDFRCDVESNLISSCPPQFLYQAKSNVQVTENIEAGTYEQSHGRIRRIQPQVVHALIKPGESVSFGLKYYHVDEEERDIYVLNSETESAGVSLTYSVDCKGIKAHGRSCSGVRNSDLIVFNVTVSIRGCSSNAVVSIGLSGVREVLALYVHPQCGCDCERPEKQEPRSGHCGGAGTLVCGACLCDDPRRGGRHCECYLGEGQTTAQLEDLCRPSPDKPICNGHGYCNCGQCVCDQNLYSGRFCDCAYTPCPKAENGHECGGRGHCYCGACQCEPGWNGPDCTCSVGTEDCMSADGKLCGGQGRCLCNKCSCLDGYGGERCEEAAGHPLAPPAPAKPTDREPEDDGDDQDDDDDDDDEGHQDETTTPLKTAEADAGGDDHPPVDPPDTEPEPEPKPEPTAEGDHGDPEDQAATEQTGEGPDGESTSGSQTDADADAAAALATPKCAVSIVLVFVALTFLTLVNRR